MKQGIHYQIRFFQKVNVLWDSGQLNVHLDRDRKEKHRI